VPSSLAQESSCPWLEDKRDIDLDDDVMVVGGNADIFLVKKILHFLSF
jgi:hypothetical protein